jgi:ABC-type iron transport system FetAB permease component
MLKLLARFALSRIFAIAFGAIVLLVVCFAIAGAIHTASRTVSNLTCMTSSKVPSRC